MKTVLDESVYRSLVGRIGRVDERSPRRWGSMGPDEMLCHCADQLRLALGHKPATETASWFNRTVAIRIALLLPRIPQRNLATPLDMRQGRGGRGTKPTALAPDRQALLGVLAEFVARPAEAPLFPHPAYGRLSRAQWGRFVYLHLDHHLRQFGA